MRRRGMEQDSTDSIEEREEQMREPVFQNEPKSTEMTVIGQGARLEGNLISAASLRIDGAVKGQITAEGDVIVATEADVTADIKAKNVTIAGKYSGNVTASGTLEMSSTARVEGNVSCGSLIVNQGAVFAGQSIMGAGASPNRLELAQPEAALED